MVPGRIPVNRQRGFTIAELLVVIAVIGIIAVTATPLFLSFLETQQTRGAAQQVSTLLNQARQLAITRNRNVQASVDLANNRLRFLFTTVVAGDVLCPDGSRCWAGPGTDTNGWMRLQNQAVITAVTADPSFNPLGTAGAGTITTQNARGSSSSSVVVSSSGRIRIQ